MSEVSVREAEAIAQGAADQACVEIGRIRTAQQIAGAAALLRQVFDGGVGGRGGEVVPQDVLKALIVSGNYVSGAYRFSQMVGCAVAFLGCDDMRSGGCHLHSHICGVVQLTQNQGVGYALKLHQRAWALQRRIPVIRWTFDPLVRRNAYFNLRKLGVTVTDYVTDFYGDLDDAVNAGDRTDRLLVEWRVDTGRVHGILNHTHGGTDRLPQQAPEARFIEVPEDIELLRIHDRCAAARHRRAIRAQFQHWLGMSYEVSAMTRDGQYVLLPKQ